MMLYIIFCDIHSFCAYMYFHLQVKYKLYRGGVKSDILVTRAFVGKLAGGWLRVVFCLVDCHERHRWLPWCGCLCHACLSGARVREIDRRLRRSPSRLAALYNLIESEYF